MDPDSESLLRQEKPEQEALKRELERRSLDTVKVYNPLDTEYAVYWDGYGHIVPSHTETTFPRYLAEKFMGEVIDKILTLKADENIESLNKKRRAMGQPPLTPQEREIIESSKEYKISDPDLRRPYVSQIWKGVVKEYGKDAILPSRNIPIRDTRPVDQRLIDELKFPSASEISKGFEEEEVPGQPSKTPSKPATVSQAA